MLTFLKKEDTLKTQATLYTYIMIFIISYLTIHRETIKLQGGTYVPTLPYMCFY